jgi:hypothetical protein
LAFFRRCLCFVARSPSATAETSASTAASSAALGLKFGLCSLLGFTFAMRRKLGKRSPRAFYLVRLISGDYPGDDPIQIARGVVI